MDARQHPVDDLLDDHKLIRLVLDAIEHEALSLEGGAELRLWFWIRATEFFETFSDRCHHRKEEDLLLPFMLAAGRSPHVAPAAEVKHEHVEGRLIKKHLQAATRDIDVDAITAAARAYGVMWRRHMEHEENEVFPMARHLFTERQVGQLSKGFGQIEHEVLGLDGRDAFQRVAHDLCNEAGVPFGENR